MMPASKSPLEVCHFQRKQRNSGNFSVEFIFQDVRQRLRDRVRFKVIFANHFSNGISNRIRNIIQAYRESGAINHITGDIHYVAALLPKRRSILTILDCGFMREKNALKRWIFKWFWLKMPVAKSEYITAISEMTKSEIMKYSGCDSEKIVVIPVAVSTAYRPAPKQFNDERPVLLQIGTAPNKNIERLVAALAGIPCRLVIIGKLSDSQQRALRDNSIDFINKFNLSSEEMIQEYVNCDIVVFASEFEGFGMPIIEANWVERPVVAGNNSSMPEVGQQAACYVDAFSVDAIREGILRVIQDENYRSNLIAQGRINRMRFDAQKIADQYFDLYHKLHLRQRRN